MKNHYKKKNSKKKTQKNPKTLPKYLEESEILSIINAAKKDKMRNYIILLTLWRTGIRVSELVNLIKTDIKEGNILIRQGKGKKDRVVPKEKELGNILGIYLDSLKARDKLFDMTDRNVRYIINKYTSPEVHAYPHIFRHSFAMHCLKKGMNIRTLQKILGHEDLETTATYLELLGKDVKEDFDKVDWA